jgi:cysteinyl-tRNA synthetase
MDDDFNTPEALAALFDLAREINRARSEDPALAAGLAAQLRALGGVLGILQDDPEAYLRGGPGVGGLSDADIEDLIRRRAEARQARAWAEADRLRDEIQAAGILLEDGAGGTRWRRG